jgi:hypothetical protein
VRVSGNEARAMLQGRSPHPDPAPQGEREPDGRCISRLTFRHKPCRTIPPPMGISQYIKEIGRGARGAKPLTREQATDLFAQVLDGTVTDLEIGGFCLAMRIKGETPEEMAGFLDATHARLDAHSRPRRRVAGGAAQLQRRTQAARAHAAAGAAAGPRRPAGAGARQRRAKPRAMLASNVLAAHRPAAARPASGPSPTAKRPSRPPNC